jgi:hypothetical protein
MALNNFKTQPVVQDDRDLMCSSPGCSYRWSVKMDGSRPFCSYHAKEDRSPSQRPASIVMPTTPPVKHWMDEEQF